MERVSAKLISEEVNALVESLKKVGDFCILPEFGDAWPFPRYKRLEEVPWEDDPRGETRGHRTSVAFLWNQSKSRPPELNRQENWDYYRLMLTGSDVISLWRNYEFKLGIVHVSFAVDDLVTGPEGHYVPRSAESWGWYRMLKAEIKRRCVYDSEQRWYVSFAALERLLALPEPPHWAWRVANEARRRNRLPAALAKRVLDCADRFKLVNEAIRLESVRLRTTVDGIAALLDFARRRHEVYVVAKTNNVPTVRTCLRPQDVGEEYIDLLWTEAIGACEASPDPRPRGFLIWNASLFSSPRMIECSMNEPYRRYYVVDRTNLVEISSERMRLCERFRDIPAERIPDVERLVCWANELVAWLRQRGAVLEEPRGRGPASRAVRRRRRSYQESFALLDDAAGLDGQPKPRARRRPQYDDENPGPSVFRTLAEDQQFENLTLPGLFIGRSKVASVSFAGSKLHHSAFNWSDFDRCDFSRCDLHDSDLRACDLKDCTFKGADLRKCDLRGSTFQGCDFSDAKLDGAMLLETQRCEIALSPEQQTTVTWTEEYEEPPGG